jgi:ATP-dependent exoDNAse (exonuclease V) alpha subunit
LQTFYELDDLAGETVRPDVVQLNKFCKPAHAWALTIHKFQAKTLFIYNSAIF